MVALECIFIIFHHLHHLVDFCLLSVGCLGFGLLGVLASWFWASWLFGFVAYSISSSVVYRFLHLPEVVVVVVDDQQGRVMQIILFANGGALRAPPPLLLLRPSMPTSVV